MNKWLFVFVIISAIPCNSESQESVRPEPVSELLLKYHQVRDFTISKSGNEAYLTLQSPLEELSVIASFKRKNKVWTKPEIADFSGAYKDLEPFLSPDNKRLYFVSNRPLDPTKSETKDFDIWYVERKDLDSDWSVPINMGKPVNTEYDEFYPSVAANQNMYFTRNSPETIGEDDIFCSRYLDNAYAVPVPLSESVNSIGYEFNSYIASDETYLIFSGYNRNDGLGSGDLYISYRNKEDQWEKAENLGVSINSEYMDYCPFVDEESGVLYFTSRRSSIKSKPVNGMEEFERVINRYENGLSRIYRVSIKSIIGK